MLKKIKTWLLTEGPVVLGARHIGWIIVALILINMGSFSIGYFWGRKSGAQEWCATISRDAFADQIYNSLCLSSIVDDQEEKEDETEGTEVADAADGDTAGTAAEIPSPEQGLEMKTQYYAQLAGFSSLRHAESFAARMNQKQIPVMIKERVSKNAKGRKLTWYQVVTEPYEDQDALNTVVAILKKEEKLHDVRIVQG